MSDTFTFGGPESTINLAKGHFPNPVEMETLLNKTVIGQKEGKRALCTAMFLHLARSRYLMKTGEINLKKQNVLIMGPTGSGKTLMIHTLCKAIGLPFLEINAKELSQSSAWSGVSLNQHINNHFRKVTYDAKMAQLLPFGVVYLDEFDKICTPAFCSNGEDVNKEIQGALLKTVDGSIDAVDEKYSQGLGSRQLLFIFSGSFHRLEEMDKINVKANEGIGFHSTVGKKIEPSHLDLQNKLIDYGMLPELAGRISTVAKLSKLTKEELKKSLLVSDRSPIQDYMKILSAANIKFRISIKDVDQFVEVCYNSEYGARGLETQFVSFIKERVYKLFEDKAKEDKLNEQNKQILQ